MTSELTAKRAFMTWVKICGMTNLEDALVAVDAGADAVGFVFYEKSPRCVTVETARDCGEAAEEHGEDWGVCGSVNPIEVLMEAGLTGTQSYFTPEEGLAGTHRVRVRRRSAAVFFRQTQNSYGTPDEFVRRSGESNRIQAEVWRDQKRKARVPSRKEFLTRSFSILEA